MVLEVLNKSNKKSEIEKNSLIELSMQNAPLKITLENDLVIWERC